MKIKKFRAKTFSEALVLVKRELGNEAVILSSEEQKGFRPSVEVTAAIDYELTAAREAGASYAQYSQADIPGSRASEHAGPVDVRPKKASDAALQAMPSDDRISMLRAELGSMKSLLQEMKSSGFGIELPAQRKKVFNYLRKRAVREELALKIAAKDPQGMEDLVSAISRDIKTYDDVRTGKVVMLIGPTGVGKTTTIAKLAARAVKNRKKVAMISLDTYRIGAIEQSRIYSKIIGIPLEIVSRPEDIKKAVDKFREKDLIFFDTTGRNPKDKRYIDELRHICSLGIPVETHLLMSAGSDDDFMVEAYRYYRDLPIDCIAFTKTDEAVKFGSIYNLASLYRKPIAYITTGQSVPADISFPDRERLARMIVKNEVAP